MTARPRLSSAAIEAALGRKPPPGFSREDRVKLIGQVAKSLLEGRIPPASARLFVAGALMAWLEGGGDLARDYLCVVKPKSRRTAAAIWRELHHRDEGEAGPDSLC